MLRPDFAFRHTVYIERWKERGISADVFLPPAASKARVDFKTHLTISDQGQTTAVGTVWLPAGTRVGTHDRIGFGGRTYIVLSCRPCYDLSGKENHVEVDIQ